MESVTNIWGKGEKSKPHLNWVGGLGVENDLTFLAVQKEPLYSTAKKDALGKPAPASYNPHSSSSG